MKGAARPVSPKKKPKEPKYTYGDAAEAKETDAFLNSITNAAGHPPSYHTDRESAPPSIRSSADSESNPRFTNVQQYLAERNPLKDLTFRGQCGRVLLLLINSLFILAGVVSIGFASYVLSTNSNTLFKHVVPIIISVFVVLTFVGLLGFLAALRCNSCLIFVAIFFHFLLQLAFLGWIGSVIAGNNGSFDKVFGTQWDRTAQSEPKVICQLQKVLQCTGWDIPCVFNGTTPAPQTPAPTPTPTPTDFPTPTPTPTDTPTPTPTPTDTPTPTPTETPTPPTPSVQRHFRAVFLASSSDNSSSTEGCVECTNEEENNYPDTCQSKYKHDISIYFVPLLITGIVGWFLGISCLVMTWMLRQQGNSDPKSSRLFLENVENA